MKKFITLLLVLTGMVSTAMAKVIYIQDTWNFKNENKKDFCVHMWESSTQSETTWPGVYLIQGGTAKVEYVVVNNETGDNQLYYKVDLGDYASFKVNNNNGIESSDLSASSYEDGGFYYIEGSGTSIYLTKATIYTYNFSVNKADGVTLTKIYLWTGDGGSAVKLVGDYPGDDFTGGDYTYRSYTDRGTINVQFNQGNDSPKTCDLTANRGNNKYYISTITTNGGQAVKTNTSGYATAVSTGHLDITSGIAYVAEDKGTWAKAHNVTGIMYGNPFLITGTASTTYCFAYGEGAALPCTNAFKAGTGTTLASETAGKYNYILNGDSFYAANGQVVRTNKAYLQLSAQVPATSRVLRFDGEDETTGIEAVDVNPETVKEGAREYYNLNGQRVMNPSKGLYIVNGKKVIIK